MVPMTLLIMLPMVTIFTKSEMAMEYSLSTMEVNGESSICEIWALQLLWLTLKADAPLTCAPRAHGVLAGKRLR